MPHTVEAEYAKIRHELACLCETMESIRSLSTSQAIINDVRNANTSILYLIYIFRDKKKRNVKRPARNMIDDEAKEDYYFEDEVIETDPEDDYTYDDSTVRGAIWGQVAWKTKTEKDLDDPYVRRGRVLPRETGYPIKLETGAPKVNKQEYRIPRKKIKNWWG